ncbi:unnamed protein product [Nippostrongylus brasiliensis]|uniref:SERPIN domain-containing protein n=1 Tax=Nippostrongylus brasiliensis TaxID=27835 RepID=A0A0N4YZL4_NIPBR|nr:unnamed protein product [Nippostrongylus brasiliensis]
MFPTVETNFGLDMLRQESVNDTLVVSPISVIFALAMVQAGAKGTTKSQITNVISNGSSDAAIQNYYSNLTRQVQNATGEVQTRIANGFFLNKQFAIKKKYEKTIKNAYSAELRSLDFNAADSSAKVRQLMYFASFLT